MFYCCKISKLNKICADYIDLIIFHLKNKYNLNEKYI